MLFFINHFAVKIHTYILFLIVRVDLFNYTNIPTTSNHRFTLVNFKHMFTNCWNCLCGFASNSKCPESEPMIFLLKLV